MPIHLIRHAHAGSRKKWEGDDRLRPLSKRGWAESRQIDRDLRGVELHELWSSPFVRCVQTLGPLAERTGLPVTEVELLAEGSPGDAALDALLAPAAAGRTVGASTHGDLVEALVGELIARGCELHGPASARKGDRYLVELEGDRPVRATHFPVVDLD